MNENLTTRNGEIMTDEQHEQRNTTEDDDRTVDQKTIAGNIKDEFAEKIKTVALINKMSGRTR